MTVRISTELLATLRYKLRTFGIPIDGPEDAFLDNQSVIPKPTGSSMKTRNYVDAYHAGNL